MWLLEELGLDYEIIPYQRHPLTRLAPAGLRAIHPLGKSPVVGDAALVLAPVGGDHPLRPGSAGARRGLCIAALCGLSALALGEDDYFVANSFSAADIQLSFVLDAAAARGPLKDYATLVRLDQRLKARPA